MFPGKSKELKILKFSCFKDGVLERSFELNKKKLLIGSSEKADIFLDDPHISSYHAFIILDASGEGKIIDLGSENGVSINGRKIEMQSFSPGDIIKFGPLEFRVDDIIEIQKSGENLIDDIDESVKIINSSQLEDTSDQLPPMPGLSVIDGEYCDITFNEDSHDNSKQAEATSNAYDRSEYIDITHIGEDAQVHNLPIVKEMEGQSIEVTILSMGSIISVDYLKVKNKTYYRSPDSHKKNTVLIHVLEEKESCPFIDIKDGKIKIHKMDQFQADNISNNEKDLFANQDSYFMETDDIINFGHKTVQVMIKVVDTPPELKKAPFFGYDKDFQVQATKVFSAIMSVMLLLLFVDITPPEPPKKKIAVIYKKAIKAKKKSTQKLSNTPSKVEKDTGVKKKTTKIKETRMAKAAAPKKAKSKPIKKKSPPKKVAKSKPTPKVKKVVKMKAYKFKMKNTLKSLMGSSKSLKNVKVSKSSKSSSASGFKTSSNLKSNLNYKSSSNIGTFGSDLSGSYDKSTGTRGLASKSGIDTTYMDPKTVVLGSMDPELLRKILREYLPQFRHCYQAELEDHSENVKGVVDLNFRIGKKGRVTKVGIRSKRSKFSKKGVNCMARVLKMIKFPKPKGGGVVDVKQPLNFSSSKSKI